MSKVTNQLKEWFDGLNLAEKKEVLKYLYRKLYVEMDLVKGGVYCGPAPGMIKEGCDLYCGPAPSISPNQSVCPSCGRAF